MGLCEFEGSQIFILKATQKGEKGTPDKAIWRREERLWYALGTARNMRRLPPKKSLENELRSDCEGPREHTTLASTLCTAELAYNNYCGFLWVGGETVGQCISLSVQIPVDMLNGFLACQHSQSLSVFLFVNEQVHVSIMNYFWTSLEEELTSWMPSSDCTQRPQRVQCGRLRKAPEKLLSVTCD